ncbi:MAG: glycosyltransferase [Candidatus Omnitrophota bacterium]|nr:MAG: glycosyltransferase [Candidatus Omnitrophota bacterium]
MKVLYISYDGAAEPIPQSQVLTYLKEINKKGVAFYWLSFEKRDSPLRSAEKRKAFREELLKSNIRWFSLPYHKRPYLLAKIFDILSGILYSSYLVIRCKINIVHGRGEVSSFMCLILKKCLFKLKFIYDRRGYMAEDYVEGGMWKGRGSPFYRLLKFIDKSLLSSSDAVVVLTERIKKILIGENDKIADKISTIPCCVDLKKFRYNSSKNIKLLTDLKLQDKFVFIYLGSLGTWYLLNEMVDFFILAKRQIPNAHFLILSMSEHSVVRDVFFRKSQTEEDFTLLKSPPGLVQNYISLADAALIFIKPVFSKLSSSPTKFAECLSCGLPVVINSNIGDCDELIRPNRIGVIVDKFDNHGYQKALEKLKGLMDEGQILRQRCRKVAEDFYPLSLGAEKYWRLYRKITS